MSTRSKPRRAGKRAGAGYEWDVFLSYSRSSESGRWVRQLFYPHLRKWLDEYAARPLKVFYDENATSDSGNWPQSVQQGLLRSRLMISVVTPAYFGSRWCKAEWESMRARERSENVAAGASGDVLIYTIAFANPNGLPLDAKRRDLADFTAWNAYEDYFKTTVAYRDFVNAVQRLVGKIVDRVENGRVPEFNGRWPVRVPRVDSKFVVSRPKLA
jgi:hypothetical protein